MSPNSSNAPECPARDRGRQAVFISYCCCSVTKSCLTLCDPMDCSPPGSSVHEILQARTLEYGFHFHLPRDHPDPGIEPTSPALAGVFFTAEPPEKPSVLLLYSRLPQM